MQTWLGLHVTNTWLSQHRCTTAGAQRDEPNLDTEQFWGPMFIKRHNATSSDDTKMKIFRDNLVLVE